MLAFYGYVGKKAATIKPFEENIRNTLTDHGRFTSESSIGEDSYIAYSEYKNHSSTFTSDSTGLVQILATGHLYEWADGKPNCSENDLSKEILVVYLKKGIHFLQNCIGHFSVAIIDKRFGNPGKVLLLKDRLGYSPLYFHCDSNGISFASRAESIGVSGTYHPQLDADALAQALYLGVILDQKSFFADVRNLAGGQLLTYQHGKYEIREPAPPSPWPEKPASHYLDCVDDLAKSMESAVQRLGRYCKKPIHLYLSGGTESRLLLSLLLRRGQDFKAVTQYDITQDNDPDVSTVKALQKLLDFSLNVEKSETMDAEITASMLGAVISDEENKVHTIVGHGWTTSGDRWNRPIEDKNRALAEQAFGDDSPFSEKFLKQLTFSIQDMSQKNIEKKPGNTWLQKAYEHNMNLYCGTFLRTTETDTHARPQNRFLGNLHLPYLDEDAVFATAKIPPMVPSKKIKLFEEVFKRFFPEQLKVPLLHKFESKKYQVLMSKIGKSQRCEGGEDIYPFRRIHTVYEKHARKLLMDRTNGLLGKVVSEDCLKMPSFPIHFSLGIVFWNSWKKLYFPSF